EGKYQPDLGVHVGAIRSFALSFSRPLLIGSCVLAMVLGLKVDHSRSAPHTVRLVADITPGPSSSHPENLIEFEGKLYFKAATIGTGADLWRLDGRTANLVADTNPGPESSNPASFEIFGEYLYFRARSEANGVELWRTDGNTVELFADLEPGPDSS